MQKQNLIGTPIQDEKQKKKLRDAGHTTGIGS